MADVPNTSDLDDNTGKGTNDLPNLYGLGDIVDKEASAPGEPGAMYKGYATMDPSYEDYKAFLETQGYKMVDVGTDGYNYFEVNGEKVKLSNDELPKMPVIISYDKQGNPQYTAAHSGKTVDCDVSSDKVVIDDTDAYRSKADGYSRLSGTGTEPEAIIYHETETAIDSDTLQSGQVIFDKATRKTYVVQKDAEGKIHYVDQATGQEVTPAVPDAALGGKIPDGHVDSSSWVAVTEEKVEGYETTKTARINGVGSTDRPDMHDQYMHHTHVTQKTGSSDRGTYEPGKTVTLANNPYLNTIVSKTGNILGKTDPKTFSKLDYIATYAATGQYSVKDLALTTDALEKNGVEFAEHPDKYFFGTIFEDIYKKTEGTAFSATAEEVQAEVERLKEEFKKVHDQMQEWSGSANDTAREAIQCILGKFEVTMGNIEMALEPSCEALDKFKEVLEKLKAEDTILLQLQEDYDKCKKKSVEHYITQRNEETEQDEMVENPEWNEWQRALSTKEAAIKAQKTKMDPILLEALEYYFQVENYSQTLTTFGDFFKAGTEKNNWISSAANIVKFHDSILTEFEDYVKMPVITNLSDYKVGQVIVFDDAHGYVYAVTGEFDPLTGTITIGCFDKDGKQIGDNITIWDQREIVPIRWVREYDPEIYDEYPDEFTTPPQTTQITPSTTRSPTPSSSTSPTPTTTTTPTTTVTVTPTHTPTITPTHTPTITPTPIITTTPHEEFPPVPPPPPPPGPPVEPPTDPYAPHTGLDALYNSSDNKEGSAGLGALAGLALGAAGLGLTGLMDDKDKEEEEKKEEEKAAKEEEPKEEEKETPENQ